MDVTRHNAAVKKHNSVVSYRDKRTTNSIEFPCRLSSKGRVILCWGYMLHTSFDSEI